MQLMEVIEIMCVSLDTHGRWIWCWWQPSKAIGEEEIPPYRQQLAAECTELKESKKQKTTTISVKSQKKKNKNKK
jgi:hypothetical protein